jgi:hypothetical protein
MNLVPLKKKAKLLLLFFVGWWIREGCSLPLLLGLCVAVCGFLNFPFSTGFAYHTRRWWHVVQTVCAGKRSLRSRFVEGGCHAHSGGTDGRISTSFINVNPLSVLFPTSSTYPRVGVSSPVFFCAGIVTLMTVGDE